MVFAWPKFLNIQFCMPLEFAKRSKIKSRNKGAARAKIPFQTRQKYKLSWQTW